MDNLSRQAYFWASVWQEGEREADVDIAVGRTWQFDDVEEAIVWLRSNDNDGGNG